MKNIFIEGIQGAGKSTLMEKVHEMYPQLKVCREGDYSPIELAWCTWMTENEYERILNMFPTLQDEIRKNTTKEDNHYIVTYTRILTDVLGFHKELEKYEIYQGRKSLEEFEEIIISRFRRFKETGYLFECSFFQNIVEDMILYYQLEDEEIVEFYRRLWKEVDMENFKMFYLFSENVEENIRVIKKERSDQQGNEMWYPLMMEYLVCSPYGKTHGYTGFDDMISHFRHRQELELRIIKEVLQERACVIPAKKWREDDITC